MSNCENDGGVSVPAESVSVLKDFLHGKIACVICGKPAVMFSRGGSFCSFRCHGERRSTVDVLIPKERKFDVEL